MNPTPLSRHREALGLVTNAVAAWGQPDCGPYVAAEAILELLAPCANDVDGNLTLDAVASIFEEFEGMLPPSLTRRLQALVSAAHRLGKSRSDSVLRFSDGVTVDTAGPLRIVRLRDGLYVTGDGMLIACSDRKDAEETLASLTRTPR